MSVGRTQQSPDRDRGGRNNIGALDYLLLYNRRFGRELIRNTRCRLNHLAGKWSRDTATSRQLSRHQQFNILIFGKEDLNPKDRGYLRDTSPSFSRWPWITRNYSRYLSCNLVLKVSRSPTLHSIAATTLRRPFRATTVTTLTWAPSDGHVYSKARHATHTQTTDTKHQCRGVREVGGVSNLSLNFAPVSVIVARGKQLQF